MTRALLALACTVAGAAAGVASVLVHDTSWLFWLLALAAPAAATVAAPPGWPRAGFAVGWAGLLLVAVLGRPEGDYLVSATPRGYGLLVLGLLLPTAAVATIPRPAP